MNRRDVLGGLTALSALPFVGACSRDSETPTSSTQRRIDKVGIQLYTVRGPMADDVPGTLERLADIGYREFEFAGYYDYSPADIRGMLEELGVSAPSAHFPIDVLRDSPEMAIETCVAIGHEYVVCPWLSEEDRSTLDKYRQHAELFNRVAEQCKAAGLGFAYHNHEFEFEAIDGVLPMDLLLAETDPSLVQIELDLYWVEFAGADPFAYFDQHPGRFPLCHVKDMAADRSMADVGTGQIDFAAIFANERAGLRHYFVERDDAPDPLASAANSFAGASAIAF